jgi:hypothetical protein
MNGPALILALALIGATPKPLVPAASRCVKALVDKHGSGEKDRIERGVAQAAAYWRSGDGDANLFEAFCTAQFLPRGAALDATFGRLELAVEALEGHQLEIHRELARWAELDIGPEQPIDGLLSAYAPAAHTLDDLFDGKVAFVVLLNFPLASLDEQLAQGAGWSRRHWAEVRLANRFARRVPAQVSQGQARARAEAEAYIADYNIYMHHVLDEDGARLFPKGKRLLSHWNLRDELKAQYADPAGLGRQRIIAKVMQRIIDQTIPAAVINDPTVDWNPFTNAVRSAPTETIEGEHPPRADVSAAREPDTRYARILAMFRTARAEDPFSPFAPTAIARKFELEMQIPEARLVALLEEVLGAPEIGKTAELIAARVGRPLEPFDIWYAGFKPSAKQSEAELDKMTRARFPTAKAFAEKLPETLVTLGFSADQARYLADHIEVDPARGSGHALEAARRGDRPHLRTRVGADGMDYKGFNIAIHELGHNVEQVFSLERVDSPLLRGVPASAITEAIAFVFQARDLVVLGLPPPDDETRRLGALDTLWATYELAGAALVEVGMWHWMYEHPQATSAQLREATLAVARSVWNKWYAPVFKVRDVTLLAIYSHMVSYVIYLPDYPVGYLVARQIEEHVRALPAGKSLGAEIERMASYGAVTPDLWMQNATGAPISTAPLLQAAATALAGTPVPH